MNVYLPKTYADWLETNPKEGQIMVIAFLVKLHSIYGTETYFEMYNEDIDTINHTEIKGQTVQTVKLFKKLGLIELANGIDLRTTIRLAKDKMQMFNRRTLLSDAISHRLSFNGALIWTYLMGRMAHVDENVEITIISKIREYENSEKMRKYRHDGKEKRATTHILPAVYAETFIKQVGQAFETPYVEKPINMTKEEYAKWYYQQKRKEILDKKKGLYKSKKTESNV